MSPASAFEAKYAADARTRYAARVEDDDDMPPLTFADPSSPTPAQSVVGYGFGGTTSPYHTATKENKRGKGAKHAK